VEPKAYNTQANEDAKHNGLEGLEVKQVFGEWASTRLHGLPETPV
jgi:hypothetical protein